jgi:hypothetical protein
MAKREGLILAENVLDQQFVSRESSLRIGE